MAFSAIFFTKESDLVIRMTSLFFRRGSEEEHVNNYDGLDNTLVAEEMSRGFSSSSAFRVP